MAAQIASHKAANDSRDGDSSEVKLEEAAQAFELSLETEPEPDPEEPDADDDMPKFGMGHLGG